MAKAGADVLIPHMGLTTKGTIGARTALTLEEAARARASAARRRQEGERRTSSSSATAARSPSRRTPSTSWTTPKGIVGFFGASSIERLPTEVAITELREAVQVDPTGVVAVHASRVGVIQPPVATGSRSR